MPQRRRWLWTLVETAHARALPARWVDFRSPAKNSLPPGTGPAEFRTCRCDSRWAWPLLSRRQASEAPPWVECQSSTQPPMDTRAALPNAAGDLAHQVRRRGIFGNKGEWLVRAAC